jgi:hypothetical protein
MLLSLLLLTPANLPFSSFFSSSLGPIFVFLLSATAWSVSANPCRQHKQQQQKQANSHYLLPTTNNNKNKLPF